MQRKLWYTVGMLLLLLGLGSGMMSQPACAQDEIQTLRVAEAVTGTLKGTGAQVLYRFNAFESTRMAVVFDIVLGDVEPTLVVLDTDQSTVLAGATGTNVNGLIVEFPAQGEYYLGITAEAGSAASFRLMIDVAPALPINAAITQSYLAAGESNQCAETVPVVSFSSTEDLNVCFSIDLITASVDFVARWWSPSGEIVLEETASMDASYNSRLLLTGIFYQGEPFEQGWWQVHFMLDGEVAHVQWVPVGP